MALLSPRRDLSEFRKRYAWMAACVTLVFLGIIGRVVQVQLMRGTHYTQLAQRNVTKTVALPAARGLIYDSLGKVLASNRPSYDLYLTPSLLRGDADLNRLQMLLELDAPELEALRKRIAQVPERRRTHQILAKRALSREQLASIEAHALELPGVDVHDVSTRAYPYGHLGAHAIGYLNEVSAKDIAAHDKLYRLGDVIGRSGIERQFESYLRGTRGLRTLIVDARGRVLDRLLVARERGQASLSWLQQRPPDPGANVTLSLDMELMRHIERQATPYPAVSVAVLEPHTGLVRALFSKPSYDLNMISGGLSQSEFRALTENPHRPLIDRTVYETYFPGSTFKLVTAVAALADGLIDPSEEIECSGAYELGNRRFRCTHVHGHVSLEEAIAASCNVYFYRIAEMIGIDRLAHYAHAMGFGEATGLALNSEAAGFIPTRAWYEARYKRRFRLGSTLNVAIGQGNTRATILQLAAAYAALANGGHLLRPALVERIESPSGERLHSFTPKLRRQLPVSQTHLDYLVDAMRRVVSDEDGTAHEASPRRNFDAAGKTGTAQVAGAARRFPPNSALATHFRRSHAWFAGFAPTREARAVVVVLVEHGGAGGRAAAPIGLNVLDYYLQRSAEGAVASRESKVYGQDS